MQYSLSFTLQAATRDVVLYLPLCKLDTPPFTVDNVSFSKPSVP
jgi:hypothetical protein